MEGIEADSGGGGGGGGAGGHGHWNRAVAPAGGAQTSGSTRWYL